MWVCSFDFWRPCWCKAIFFSWHILILKWTIQLLNLSRGSRDIVRDENSLQGPVIRVFTADIAFITEICGTYCSRGEKMQELVASYCLLDVRETHWRRWWDAASTAHENKICGLNKQEATASSPQLWKDSAQAEKFHDTMYQWHIFIVCSCFGFAVKEFDHSMS